MMSLAPARKIVRGLLLGDTDLPQQCNVAMPDPQDEISVWLHGEGVPRDVTDAHALACAAPFTIGIGLDDSSEESGHLSLRFCERHGERRVLGEIGLRGAGTIRTKGQTLCLFEARSCRNYCLPWMRLWAHRLFQAYVRGRRGDPDVRMNALGARSMTVGFICPRPVVLVSVIDGENGSIFPMNLFGPIGKGYIAFALNSSRQAAPLAAGTGSACRIQQHPIGTYRSGPATRQEPPPAIGPVGSTSVRNPAVSFAWDPGSVFRVAGAGVEGRGGPQARKPYAVCGAGDPR